MCASARSQARWYGWPASSDQARYICSANITRARPCGSVRFDSDQTNPALRRQLSETPSGPPMMKHRSRPSVCQSDSFPARSWLPGCLPRSSSRTTCSSAAILVSNCSPSDSMARRASSDLLRLAVANDVQPEFPLRRKTPGVALERLVDPRGLAFADRQQPDMHGRMLPGLLLGAPYRSVAARSPVGRNDQSFSRL